MKYKVIGWTDSDICDYPPHGVLTACVEAAVAKEIREHKYCFGGDAHEMYCPVLNDGTYLNCSWRGWGGIMARAWDEDDGSGYAYSLYYMDRMIDPKRRKYPKTEEIDEDQIVPRFQLAETFVMYLNKSEFAALEAGEKTVEVRPFDELSKKIDYEDYIEFRCENDEGERITTKVVDLELRKNFHEMFLHRNYDGMEGFNYKSELRFSAKRLGVDESATIESLTEEKLRQYGEESEKEGVMAFIFEKVKPFCHTEFIINCDKHAMSDISELINDFDETELAEIKELTSYLAEQLSYMDAVESDLLDIPIEFVRSNSSFTFGANDDYDVDVNVMLRKTAGELFGYSGFLKEIQQKYGVTMSLVICVGIVANSDEPTLSLDTDIEKFLHDADVDLKIDYKFL